MAQKQMAYFRGVKIDGPLLRRDDSVADVLVPFSAEALRAVTHITDECFGLSQAVVREVTDTANFFRRHHDKHGPSVLDLSLLVNCVFISDYFAAGHYGPVILPPNLQTVEREFMVGAKFRVLEFPPSLQSLGDYPFTFVTAEQVVFLAGLERVPRATFSGATMATVTIPGSVGVVETEFCSDATVGTVTFEESKDSVRLLPEAFNGATVQTLVFRRSVDFHWSMYGSSLERAKISVLQHMGAQAIRDSFPPDVDVVRVLTGDEAPKIETVVLGAVDDAELFPESIFILGDRNEAAQAPAEKPGKGPAEGADAPPPPDQELPGDLASITQLESHHCRHLVAGGTVDMSMMTSCTAIGEACFTDLTSVNSIKFPPNLATIGHSFMKGAACPALVVTFPSTLQQLGPEAMAQARVRSVDMGKCDALKRLSTEFLEKASLEFLTLPPNLQGVRPVDSFLAHLDCPTLDIVFPKHFQAFGPSMLTQCNVRSLDFGQCEKLDQLPSGFLESCTLAAFTFPPNLAVILSGFMKKATAPGLDLVFPKALKKVDRSCFAHAKLRSLDFGKCDLLLEASNDLLTHAKIEGLVLPPNLERADQGRCFNFMEAPVHLVFPRSLKSIGIALVGARLKSVDFGQCVHLTKLSRGLLSKSTIESFVFPPNVTSLDDDFMFGVECPTLDLTLPATVANCADFFLHASHVRTVDLSACASLTALGTGFMKQATAQQCLLPPAITAIDAMAFDSFTCSTFAFVGPETLKCIGADVFSDASIASIDVTASPLLESIGNSFMAGAKLGSPASLAFSSKLTSVGPGFCSGAKLRRLDMRECKSVTKLPDFFLFRAECVADESVDATTEPAGAAQTAGTGDDGERLHLPPFFAEIGGSCLAMSKGFTTVAAPSSKGSLRVGDSFAADSDVEVLSWAYRRVVVGHSFCKNVSALRVVCARGFTVVGNDFCAGVGDLTLDLSSAPLIKIGTGFLQRSSLNEQFSCLDLSRAVFTECPENFMHQSRFSAAGKIVLPPTVSAIAPWCCAEVARLETFAFSTSASPLARPATSLSIEHGFLRSCPSLTTAALPDFVNSFGDFCFADCPALTIKLTLPHVRRIGNDFLAKTERSGGEPQSPLSLSPRDQARQDDKAAALQAPHTTAALHDVCPYAVIGDNFVAHAHCTALTFAAAHAAVQEEHLFVKRDELFKELDGALSVALAAGLLEPVVALKELVSLRTQLLLAMAETHPGFRSISVELDALSADMEADVDKHDRAECLAKELRCEEDHIFKEKPPPVSSDSPDAPLAPRESAELEALERRRYSDLAALLRRKIKCLGKCSASKRKARGERGAAGPAPTIGDGFLANTTGISQLDMSVAMHTTIGDRFAAQSSIHEVQLPMSVKTMGKDLCAGCLATVSSAPSGGGQDDCYLSSWMDIRIEKERMDTLTHFRDLLPTSEWAGMARWLLQQKCFAEFKGLFNVREDAANLRHVGGTVDDLPDLPGNVPAWPGFELTVATHDSCLSLLHWAVKYSHQFPHLLSEASWSLADLTLVTEQGFTALHYAVLYDIETAALKRLLDIAAKAEIHGTWSAAWSAGGVRVSPLHLAYLYRRDTIVKELLAFEWDPTEPIKDADANRTEEGDAGEGGSDNFDAFDQAVMELGQARTAAFLDAQDTTASDEKALRLPVAVQLFHAAVLMCVASEFEHGLDAAHTIDGGIHRAFIVLRHKLTTDFPLLSQNKWSQARQVQRDVAARGSGESEMVDDKWIREFLQDAFAAAFSDPDHSSHVRIQYRHVLADTGALRAFVMTEFEEQLSQRSLTFALVGQMIAKVQSRFRRIQNARQGPSAPPITTETLLLRTQSMEDGPHRSNVEEKLANVIPFRFVIPVLPFFYLMLLIVFGLSWFFHPPILAPTLMGIENAIADCTNPYNTKDATEDGVIPWDCDVGFTELGMQVETFPKPASTKSTAVAKMQSFFSFIERENIPRNVTHLPWAYLRFSTVVNYNGLKTKATSVADAEAPPAETKQEYWVLTELQKLPDWAPEIFEQKNTKANESTISFKGETTRTFAHTVIPYGFGSQTLIVVWMIGVMVMLLTCVAAFVYHGYAFSNILREREVRLVEVSTIQRSYRSILLACEVAAVLFIAVGVCLMAVTFDTHKDDQIITRATAGKWQRVEIFFRVGLTFCSFRAVSFFSEMPKPHHFAMVNASVVGVGLVAALVGLYVIPTSRVGLAASLKSLLSIQAVDALTLPIVLGVALFFRSSKVSDEVRQAHYENLLADMNEEKDGTAAGGALAMKPRASLAARTTRDQESDTASSLHDEKPAVSYPIDHAVDGHTAVRIAPAPAAPAPAVPPEVTELLAMMQADSSDPDFQIGFDMEKFAEMGMELPPELLAGIAAAAGIGHENGPSFTEVHPFESSKVSIDGDPGGTPPPAPPAEAAMQVDGEYDDCLTPLNDDDVIQTVDKGEMANAKMNDDEDEDPLPWNLDTGAAAVRALTRRRRFLLSWAVIVIAGLGQVLLYGLALTVIVRPLLTLPSPGGAFPVTGESFMSSDDLGMVNFAQKLFF